MKRVLEGKKIRSAAWLRQTGLSRVTKAKRTPKKGWLATEVRDEPEEDGERDAEDQTSHDRKVERGVFAAVNDVAGKFSYAEGEFVPEIEKDTDQDEEPPEEDERAAEFAPWIHGVILPEPNESFVKGALSRISV